jgi:hypothetical protein
MADMRVTDPVGGMPDLQLFFENYDRHFRRLKHYSSHLRWMVARYSRGDSADELRQAFRLVVNKVAEMENDGRGKVFAHEGRYASLFRDAVVLLSFGLCLHSGKDEMARLLNSCDRGDSLIELLASAAFPDLPVPSTGPAFYPTFHGLYDAIRASGRQRARLIADYLGIWYTDKMDGFPFKDLHLERDPSDYVGYWCFEAAGVVAALGIDDGNFSSHPHYPKDLVAMYRACQPRR